GGGRAQAGAPAGRGAGGPAVGGALGVRHAVVEIAILRGTGRRPLTEVEREGAAAREPAQCEATTADTARRGVHDAPGGCRRDGCIDGATALAPDLRARFGSEAMLGGDGADAGIGCPRAGEGEGHPGGESKHVTAAIVPYQQRQTLAAAAACAKGGRERWRSRRGGARAFSHTGRRNSTSRSSAGAACSSRWLRPSWRPGPRSSRSVRR